MEKGEKEMIQPCYGRYNPRLIFKMLCYTNQERDTYESLEDQRKVYEGTMEYIDYEDTVYGNPTMYREMEMMWDRKQLKEVNITNGEIKYQYNHNGIRIEKEVNGVKTEYYLEGSNIIAEQTGGNVTYYHYDTNGELVGFTQNKEDYFYVRNLIGEITEVVDKKGISVISYKYNGFGEVISEEKVEGYESLYNPFQYKGYYKDEETGLYYLNSRYYDPVIKRFISTDDPTYLDSNNINGLNLYAYCNYNPVMYYDPNGNIAFFAITMIIGAIAYGTYRGIKAYSDGSRGWELVGEVGKGIIIGGVVGALAGLTAGSLLSGNFLATTSQVWLGVKGLAWAWSIGGPGAAAMYMVNNFLHSIHIYSNSIGYYPPNDGFASQTNTTLNPGDVVQRIGSTHGTFVSSAGATPFELSLPYDKLSQVPNFYIVNQPIDVVGGPAAPWFGQYGGGMQYVLPEKLQELINQGIISIFGG